MTTITFAKAINHGLRKALEQSPKAVSYTHLRAHET